MATRTRSSAPEGLYSTAVLSGVAADVLVECPLGVVLPGVDVHDLAGWADEDRRGEALDRGQPREAAGARLVARVADVVLGEERARVAGGIVGVGAEERDLSSVAGRGGGEQTELRAARPAPRCPGVDHDRIAPQRADAGGERGLATEQLVCLLVQRGQWWR